MATEAPDEGEGQYNEPRLAINRVYTRKGDSGKTALVGGQRVEKDALRIEAYGTVDELSATVGLARVQAEADPRYATLARELLRVQHELFNLGSLLATLPEDLHPAQARVGEADIQALESSIDTLGDELEPLRSFVLPGAHALDAALHLARTVCRRAERGVVRLARETDVDPLAVTYLNRLSDALFVWGRWSCKAAGVSETLWQPNAAASGQTADDA